MDTMKG